MSVKRAYREVRRQLHRGVPFEHIEAYIENTGLEAEARALLWLLAWADGDLQAVSYDLGRTRELESVR